MEYRKSPFTLLPVYKIRKNEKTYKDDDLIQSSVYTDWIKFLTFNGEILTTGWYKLQSRTF